MKYHKLMLSSKTFININIDFHEWACIVTNVNLLIENSCNKGLFCKSVLKSIITSKRRVGTIYIVPLIYMFNLNARFLHQKWNSFLPILYLCVDFQLHFNASKQKNFELVPSFLINRFNIAIFLSMSQVGI